MSTLTDDEYFDFLDFLDTKWQESLEKATDSNLDPAVRDRWAGAMWAFEWMQEYLEPQGE